MKRNLLLFLMTFFGTVVSAQTSFEPHVVIDNSFGSQDPNSAQAADIEGKFDSLAGMRGIFHFGAW